MNITQLRYFHAVCTYHSLSNAAEYLHISQPSLSNSIKELEQEFGVVLFHRHHRGMTLTAEGEALFHSSLEILRGVDHAEALMRGLGKERKRLRLGVPPMIGSMILPKIYRTFTAQNPDVALEITEGGRQELMQRLREERVDMVFLSHSTPLDRAFSTLKLARLPIVCCTTKNSPLSKLSSVRPEDVSQTPLVLFENSFFQTEKIRKWFADGGVSPKVVLQTEQLSTMLSIISSDIAAGFMFRQLADSNAKLITIPTEEPLWADVSLVWKKDSYVSDGMKLFTQYVKNQNPLTDEDI